MGQDLTQLKSKAFYGAVARDEDLIERVMLGSDNELHSVGETRAEADAVTRQGLATSAQLAAVAATAGAAVPGSSVGEIGGVAPLVDDGSGNPIIPDQYLPADNQGVTDVTTADGTSIVSGGVAELPDFANKATGATPGNIATLDADGNPVDSGKDFDDVGAVDGAVLNGNTITPDGNKLLQLGNLAEKFPVTTGYDYALAVNAGGSGYQAGDSVTIGALTAEVDTVGGGGAIEGFANINPASGAVPLNETGEAVVAGPKFEHTVTIDDGGTGYAVDDAVTFGIFTVEVDTVDGGGEILTLKNVSPASGTTDETAAGEAISGGSGTGATVDITSADVRGTGATADISSAPITDMKNLIDVHNEVQAVKQGAVQKQSGTTQIIDSNIALDMGNEILGIDADRTQHVLMAHMTYVTAAEFAGSKTGYGVPFTWPEIQADQSLVDYVPQGKAIKTSDNVWLWYDTDWDEFTPLATVEQDEYSSGAQHFNGNSKDRPTFDVTGLGHKFNVAELADIPEVIDPSTAVEGDDDGKAADAVKVKEMISAASLSGLTDLFDYGKTLTVTANPTTSVITGATLFDFQAKQKYEYDGTAWNAVGSPIAPTEGNRFDVFKWLDGTSGTGVAMPGLDGYATYKNAQFNYFCDADSVIVFDGDTIKPRTSDGAVEVASQTMTITEDTDKFSSGTALTFKNFWQGVLNKINGIITFITRAAGFATSSQGSKADTAAQPSDVDAKILEDRKYPILTVGALDYFDEIKAKYLDLGGTLGSGMDVLVLPTAGFTPSGNTYIMNLYLNTAGETLFITATRVDTGVKFVASYDSPTSKPVWGTPPDDAFTFYDYGANSAAACTTYDTGIKPVANNNYIAKLSLMYCTSTVRTPVANITLGIAVTSPVAVPIINMINSEFVFDGGRMLSGLQVGWNIGGNICISWKSAVARNLVAGTAEMYLVRSANTVNNGTLRGNLLSTLVKTAESLDNHDLVRAYSFLSPTWDPNGKTTASTITQSLMDMLQTNQISASQTFTIPPTFIPKKLFSGQSGIALNGQDWSGATLKYVQIGTSFTMPFDGGTLVATTGGVITYTDVAGGGADDQTWNVGVGDSITLPASVGIRQNGTVSAGTWGYLLSAPNPWRSPVSENIAVQNCGNFDNRYTLTITSGLDTLGPDPLLYFPIGSFNSSISSVTLNNIRVGAITNNRGTVTIGANCTAASYASSSQGFNRLYLQGTITGTCGIQPNCLAYLASGATITGALTNYGTIVTPNTGTITLGTVNQYGVFNDYLNRGVTGWGKNSHVRVDALKTLVASCADFDALKTAIAAL
ncbi:hypothetical protein AGMMS49940_05830 [Spirochaetia bacterium]|nr:hypothetical protein AGMMS49940_05830 [Spirochaetia bacterium]